MLARHSQAYSRGQTGHASQVHTLQHPSLARLPPCGQSAITEEKPAGHASQKHALPSAQSGVHGCHLGRAPRRPCGTRPACCRRCRSARGPTSLPCRCASCGGGAAASAPCAEHARQRPLPRARAEAAQRTGQWHTERSVVPCVLALPAAVCCAARMARPHAASRCRQGSCLRCWAA